MIGQQFQQLWTSDDNIHPLQDEPYKSTFFFFNTPDHEELNAEDASTGSVYSVVEHRDPRTRASWCVDYGVCLYPGQYRSLPDFGIRLVGFPGTITFEIL